VQGNRIIKKYLPQNITCDSLDFGKSHKFNFSLDDRKFPINDKVYDLIICTETLEHVMHPQRVINEIKRVAKPDATLFFSMPNEYNFVSRIYFLLGKKTMVNEPFQIVEKHLHIHKPSIKDILNLFSNNFKIIEVEYL